MSEKAFKDLRVGDIIYRIDTLELYPGYKKCKVIGMRIHSHSQLEITPDPYSSITLQYESRDKTEYHDYYTSEEECQDKLKGECIKRIIYLSSYMGTLDKVTNK